MLILNTTLYEHLRENCKKQAETLSKFTKEEMKQRKQR